MGIKSILRNLINTRKGVKTTNGMTLGGAKEPMVLKKGPRCCVYPRKNN
jgi:hypothetical protein